MNVIDSINHDVTVTNNITDGNKFNQYNNYTFSKIRS